MHKSRDIKLNLVLEIPCIKVVQRTSVSGQGKMAVDWRSWHTRELAHTYLSSAL
jgi:hypothetical protein